MTMSFASPSPSKRSRKSGFSKSSRDFSNTGLSKLGSNPYNTPFKSRNQSLCRPNIEDTQTKRAVGKLKHFLNRKWYTFNVSPMYNLNCSEVSFKRYARRLKETLLARLSEQTETEYEVSYSLYSNMKLNNIDHEAIEITVVKIPVTGNRSIAYNAILLSWGATRKMQPENATFLPILLCCGLKNVIKQVHWEIQAIHDCFISPFDVHDEEMRMLTVGILQNFTYENDSVIKLRYNLPQNSKSGNLDITLPILVLSKLWKCIHGTDAHQLSDEEATMFWREFHSHTYRSFGIDLGHCGLVMVSFPDAILSPDAILARRKEHMYLLLSFLMSLNTSLTSVA